MNAKVALSAARSAPTWLTAAVTLATADVAAMLGLSILAAAVRLPNLLTVPRFTDEQLDVLYTLPLYRHQAVPLVGWDPYNGALFSYLLAAALWLFGPQPYTPRLLALLIGTATVAATYLLGRVLGGRLAGLVAASLLGTSATHALVNSHVAWSNSTTPLFTTLAFCALIAATTANSGIALALSGLLFGLALQTHPSVAAFLPGAGLAMLLLRPAFVPGRWTILGIALFILAYANVLLYNLLPAQQAARESVNVGLLPGWGLVGKEDTYSRLVQQQRTYSVGQGGPEFFLTNLGSLALNLPRIAGSLIESRGSWWDYLLQPSFWIYGLLALVGLVWPAARKSANVVPMLSGLSFLLFLPLFIGKFDPIFNGRYLMPLLPLSFAGLGTLVADLWSSASCHWKRFALAVTVVAAVVYPLASLSRYEQGAASEGQLNLDLIQSAGALDAALRPAETLLLDEALGRRGLPADGDLLQNLRLFLELREVPYRVGAASPTKLEIELAGANTALVVFAQPYDRALEERFRLTQIEEKISGRYAAYRLERRG